MEQNLKFSACAITKSEQFWKAVTLAMVGQLK